MPLTLNELTPQYGWNSEAQRYIDLSTGRFVTAAQVRTALDMAIMNGQSEIQHISTSLVNGQINLADWQTQMANQIRMIHLASASLAVGGWAQMTPADYGRVGAALRLQYQYLQQFAMQIELGAQPLNGRLITRAMLYGQAGRAFYEEMLREQAIRSGMNQERRVLGAAEHCDDCVRISGMGWRPIGSLPRIGNSKCRTNCKCAFQYRKVQTGDLGGFGL